MSKKPRKPPVRSKRIRKKPRVDPELAREIEAIVSGRVVMADDGEYWHSDGHGDTRYPHGDGPYHGDYNEGHGDEIHHSDSDKPRHSDVPHLDRTGPHLDETWHSDYKPGHVDAIRHDDTGGWHADAHYDTEKGHLDVGPPHIDV